jgi:predicted enzyme related to lactoylglutathione lyase
MLENNQGFASFSVKDAEQAKQFYGQTLGLKVSDSMGGGFTFQVEGNLPVFVYPKDNHEPATFTVFNFLVGDIDESVDQLTAAGVQFEHYDVEFIKTDDKGIARGDGAKMATGMAWFKDPSGNILSVIQK